MRFCTLNLGFFSVLQFATRQMCNFFSTIVALSVTMLIVPLPRIVSLHKSAVWIRVTAVYSRETRKQKWVIMTATMTCCSLWIQEDPFTEQSLPLTNFCRGRRNGRQRERDGKLLGKLETEVWKSEATCRCRFENLNACAPAELLLPWVRFSHNTTRWSLWNRGCQHLTHSLHSRPHRHVAKKWSM